jgi:hypothetical protein
MAEQEGPLLLFDNITAIRKAFASQPTCRHRPAFCLWLCIPTESS